MTAQRLDFKDSLKVAKAELFTLQEELGILLEQQEAVEKKIVAVRQMIVAFSNVTGELFEEADEMGMTEAIRQAFKANKGPLEPTAVRTRVQELGFDTKKYGNFMASVHTVINRLVQQGELKQQLVQPGNRNAYVWVIK
jgi:hypothetical protein